MTETTPQRVDQLKADCAPATRVTKSLLGYGIIAGPIYVVISLAEAITRPGFDLTRHSWSLLAAGDFGWIHVVNFILTGLMVITAAAGMRRHLGETVAAKWAGALIGVYGASLIGAGIFSADPMDGFPIGTPAGPVTPSWHGMLHLGVGGIGFLAFIAACFIIARQLSRRGERGWARFSIITGIVFFAAFGGIASGGATSTIVLAFTFAVILAWTWLSLLSAKFFKESSNGKTFENLDVMKGANS